MVQAGSSRNAVTAHFGLGKTTLRRWIEYVQVLPSVRPRFSPLTPAQKYQLVQELRAGKVTEAEALQKSGLHLKRSLRKWVAAQVAAEATSNPTVPALILPAADVKMLTAHLHQLQVQLAALHQIINQA
jgi:hypothetical protein